MQLKFRLTCLAGVALVLSACLGEDDNKRANNEPDPAGLNTPPTITGSPSSSILEGEPYVFMPAASDADGDSLEFSIARKPAWASFDRATGRLSGTPDAEDVGTFTNIGISVSDGTASTALPDFNVAVNQIAAGQATLSWNPPTDNSDGSTLTDLASYRIYYGRNRDNLTEVVVLDNPGLTRYVVENLTPARWYFSMSSVNTQGDESSRSSLLSASIS